MAPAACALLLGLAGAPATGQPVAADPPKGPELVRSMGQPLVLKPYLAGTMNWSRWDGSQLGAVGIAGVYRDLVLPVSGAFGVSVEGYGGVSGGTWDGGARVLATSRLLFLNVGVDWNAQAGNAHAILAWTPYFKRGGLFGTGGNFRIEWIPGRDHSLNFGFQVPLEPHMGRTRPARTAAALPQPPPRPPPRPRLPPEAEPALEDLRRHGEWAFLNTNAFNDENGKNNARAMEKFRAELGRIQALFRTTDAEHPQGRSYALEARHYHEALDRAFGVAAGPAAALAVAGRARDVLLEHVLLPYDRLIGQFKKPDTLHGLNARALGVFDQGLPAIPGLDPGRHEAALAVFEWLLRDVEDGRRRLLAHWDGDERNVWLPLDLALRPGEHDSQEELDALVERAVGRSFSRGDVIYPTNASRFQIELLRSLEKAEEYHVLWIHDFAGRVDGRPDPVAFEAAIEGYLRALTHHVRNYDETGRLPVFLIFHTQFFYDGSGGRLFLSLLEDPLGHELRLGSGFRQMEETARAAQEELRRAVAGSKRLQAEARRHGEGWLRRVVKVHVSVTLPADLSFRTKRVLEGLRFAPDSLMLDHRKFFFYDVTEEDPGRGRALFTGTGVGSEYASPTWDDRGLLVSGPSLVELKSAARRLLRSQGFRDEEIPTPLRPRPRPPDYDAKVAERLAAGYHARGLNLHNEVGFAAKESTLVQALLYTLSPPDTLLVSPDSIWTSPLWAGQLVGAALRGCHVYLVAPSLGNAPAAGSPLMARTREIFSRLLESRQGLAGEIAAAGGHLRVGLYTRLAPSGDTLAKVREAAEGIRRQPFLEEEFPMPRGTVELFDEEAARMEAGSYAPHFLAEGTRAGRPKMHRKTQLIATRRVLRALADEPWTREALRRQVTARADATSNPQGLLEAQEPLGFGMDLMRSLESSPATTSPDALFYLTAGSKNQDPRGAALDGETTYVVAGPWTLYLYSDFLFLMSETTWLEDESQLAELIPVKKERHRKLGRFMEKIL